VVAIVRAGGFMGEGCLAGQVLRKATAVAMIDSSCTRVEKAAMIQLLHQRGEFSGQFMGYLLRRNIRIEADLVDQLFNSSEKRLARTLLLLARFGEERAPQTVVPWVSHDVLAKIVGMTRSRVSYFMNTFRRLSFIEYTDKHNGGLGVHSSLLNVPVRFSSPRSRPSVPPCNPL
jgi:CRP/FNR family transcriptional regulator, cyclic AMP receptor protein